MGWLRRFWTFRRASIGVLSGAMVLITSIDARADIVVFKTGRTMSVKSAQADGDRLTLVLRDGGEATFARSAVERIDPDEVPWPEPEDDIAVTGSPEALSVERLHLAPDATLSAKPFANLIDAAASTHGVDPRLVHALIEVESNYEPRARSKKGAKGLMQLMPETARQYAVRDPYDPRANIEAGVRHLKDLLSRFDVTLALAAYNAGEGAVRRFGRVPPYAETKAYVSKVLQRARP
jgi:hypothetical protein